MPHRCALSHRNSRERLTRLHKRDVSSSGRRTLRSVQAGDQPRASPRDLDPCIRQLNEDRKMNYENRNSIGDTRRRHRQDCGYPWEPGIVRPRLKRPVAVHQLPSPLPRLSPAVAAVERDRLRPHALKSLRLHALLCAKLGSVVLHQ
jgi:hypothetical protein